MSGAKLKNLVILLLLVVDLILLAMFSRQVIAAKRLERQAARDAVTALQRLGLEVSEELLSADAPALYTREEERSTAAERRAAELLLGSLSVKNQGGGIYTGETDRGRVRLSNAGSFELVLYPPYPTGITPEMTPEELLAAAGLEEAGIAALSLSGGAQMIGGAPVFDRDLTLRETEEGLLLSGGLLMGEIYISDGTPSKSLTAALFTLAGELEETEEDAPERVLSAEQGYLAELLAENYTTLRPVWRITTDKGVYTVDSITLKPVDSSVFVNNPT